MADICYMGDDLDVWFEAVDVYGNAIDTSGATFYCSAKTGAGAAVAATCSIVSSATRPLRATFPKATTAAFTAGAIYTYDGLLRLASGELHTVGRGQFTAQARVTSNPS